MSLCSFFWKSIKKEWLLKIAFVSGFCLFFVNLLRDYDKQTMNDYLLGAFDYIAFGSTVIPAYLIILYFLCRTFTNEMTILGCKTRIKLAGEVAKRVLFGAFFYSIYFSAVTFGISALCSASPYLWITKQGIRPLNVLPIFFRTAMVLFLFFLFYGIVFSIVQLLSNAIIGILILTMLPLIDFGLTLYYEHFCMLFFIMPPDTQLLFDNANAMKGGILFLALAFVAMGIYIYGIFHGELGLNRGERRGE